MYKVTNKIPAPTASSHGRLSRVYPFAEMSIGDSFEVPASEAVKARVAVANWRSNHPGWGYRTAKAESGGIRIWRIS